MGTSGSGGGSGGSGGSGGGSGGSGGSTGGVDTGDHMGYESLQEAEEKQKEGKKSTAQLVLTRLHRDYLLEQVAGNMTKELIKNLLLLGVDVKQNRSWESLCARLRLAKDSSLADVRDKILQMSMDDGSDDRMLKTRIAALELYFLELVQNDDDLLYGRGSNEVLEELDLNVLDNLLESYMTFLLQHMLQREEPQILDEASQDGLEAQAAERAKKLTSGLRSRFGSKEQTTEATLLTQATANDKEKEWLLRRLRN